MPASNPTSQTHMTGLFSSLTAHCATSTARSDKGVATMVMILSALRSLSSRTTIMSCTQNVKKKKRSNSVQATDQSQLGCSPHKFSRMSSSDISQHTEEHNIKIIVDVTLAQVDRCAHQAVHPSSKFFPEEVAQNEIHSQGDANNGGC